MQALWPSVIRKTMLACGASSTEIASIGPSGARCQRSLTVISPEMRGLRELPVTARRDNYLEGRLRNQRRWYAGKAKVNASHEVRWFYAQPYSFLPVNTFTLFLLGFIGLRLGVFDEPGKHKRLIVSLGVFGVLSWGFVMFVADSLAPVTQGGLLRTMVLNRLQYGFSFLRDMWLSFAYIGVVLLLVARNRAWLTRLAMFAWTGRMALTNYMIQIAILDLTFAKYALGLTVTPLTGLTMAIALFVVDALVSRWWLARFRFGPCEWAWRSLTYGAPQPMRLPKVALAS